MTRYIRHSFYRGPVPFDPNWKPNGNEHFVWSHGEREDDRKAIEDAARHWQGAGA